ASSIGSRTLVLPVASGWMVAAYDFPLAQRTLQNASPSSVLPMKKAETPLHFSPVTSPRILACSAGGRDSKRSWTGFFAAVAEWSGLLAKRAQPTSIQSGGNRRRRGLASGSAIRVASFAPPCHWPGQVVV